MIISRTPFRISFAGGGTDLPSFYRKTGGAVLSTSIDKYIYITANPKFDHKIRASYSVTEIVDRLEELRHPLVRECLRRVGIHQGIEITSISDIPSEGTGLGSSSAYTVGLLHALRRYRGETPAAEQMAAEACRIEIEILGEPIGKQDQYAAACGGLRFIEFHPDESVSVEAVPCAHGVLENLQARLLLFYTGITRSTRAILGAQTEQRENSSTHDVLKRQRDHAYAIRAVLERGDLDAFGKILHEAWMLKRSLAGGVSNGQIDRWYEMARRHGATGGKILGAGGGGFLLLDAPPKRHDEIRAALPELRQVPFRFDSEGSRIIYP